jgi:thiol-disulfide isomerase/thioredoxin
VRARSFILLVGGLAIGLLLAASVVWSGKAMETTHTPLAAGVVVPGFDLVSLTGEHVKLSDLQGKILLVNFWATWCIPCKDEIPVLAALQKEYQNQVVVIGINAGEMSGVVQNFVDKNDISYTVLLDENNAVTDQYLIRAFPTTLIIDRQGALIAEHIGPLTSDIIQNYIGGELK